MPVRGIFGPQFPCPRNSCARGRQLGLGLLAGPQQEAWPHGDSEPGPRPSERHGRICLWPATAGGHNAPQTGHRELEAARPACTPAFKFAIVGFQCQGRTSPRPPPGVVLLLNLKPTFTSWGLPAAMMLLSRGQRQAVTVAAWPAVTAGARGLGPLANPGRSTDVPCDSCCGTSHT